MGFLTLIPILFDIASKALELGGYRWSQRRKARAELEQQYKKLEAAIVSEGRRIESYLEFDNLIDQIEGGLDVIIGSNKRTREDDPFWSDVERTHQLLQRAVCDSLGNFDVTRFNEFHQGRVAEATRRLEEQIQQAQALFRRQREEYYQCLLAAVREVGRLRGFGRVIVKEVSKSLVDFRGA